MDNSVKDFEDLEIIFANICFACLYNKGEFRSRPISAFVYIFVLNQSGCRKAKIVNKTSEEILPSSRALVQVNFNFFDLKQKYYDRTH